MSGQAERVKILLALSDELRRCGPTYLAALLVSEAYARECLEGVVFRGGSLDAAVREADARLRRTALPAPAPIATAVPPRRARVVRTPRVAA
mgnify:CR=1 FL=1